jgi:hypothetical protein
VFSWEFCGCSATLIVGSVSVARAEKESMPVPDIAPKKTGKVPTEYLDFNPNNPRLVEDGIKPPTHYLCRSSQVGN